MRTGLRKRLIAVGWRGHGMCYGGLGGGMGVDLYKLVFMVSGM